MIAAEFFDAGRSRWIPWKPGAETIGARPTNSYRLDDAISADTVSATTAAENGGSAGDPPVLGRGSADRVEGLLDQQMVEQFREETRHQEQAFRATGS
ncbi:hypothetical protein ACIO14_25480 [Nocardia fluminea]|uniref:hypothetical protein n=1 Tax=Nocardia fluminea TaxID=134984 RepID=UPI0038066C17